MAGVILLLLAAVALSLTVQHYYRLAAEMSDWQASLSKFERRVQVKPKHHDVLDVVQEIRHANEILRQLSLPWEKLFRAVESSVNQEVTLLGMEPDIEKHIVHISCEAKNIGAMLNYIRQLEKQHDFGSVYLQSHQIQERDPEKPVRFSLVAAWEVAP